MQIDITEVLDKLSLELSNETQKRIIAEVQVAALEKELAQARGEDTTDGS